MNDLSLFFASLCLCASLPLGYRYLIQWRAMVAASKPFPEDWLRIVARVLPQYRAFSAYSQQRLQKKIQKFIAHKTFVAQAGVLINDELKITIAAQACLLVLRQPVRQIPFADVKRIDVYPDELVVRNSMRDVGDRLGRLTGLRWGQNANRKRVILAWSGANKAVYDFNQGQNVALQNHIYAGQGEALPYDGTVVLRSNGAIGTWAAHCANDYQKELGVHSDAEKKSKELFGALNLVEFFSAATENFFVKPLALLKGYPEVYKQFKDFYKMDPCAWKDPSPN